MGARGMPMPGLQPDEAQAPQPAPQQQAQQPDADEQLKQHFLQQYQELAPKQPQGGPIKRMLSNFFAHGQEALAVDLGVPTNYQKQQDALKNYQNVSNIQSNVDLRKATMANFEPVPLIGLDQKPIIDPTSGKPITVPAHVAQGYYAGLNNALTRQSSAETAATAKTDVAKINQGGGLQLPVDASTAELAGVPELEGKTLGKGGWDMLNKALTAKGFKIQDMGFDGPNGGTQVIDRGGNKVHQVSPHSLMQARGQSIATARAAVTPFETVEPGTNIPKTISNLEAVRSGAPRVSLASQTKLGGQYSLYNDAYGILDKIDQLTEQVNLDDSAVRARVTAGYAALKDPASKGLTGEVLSNFLARQPVSDQLQPNERDLVLTLAQGKAAATGLRSILGQAGANEMQQRLDSGLFPGGQAVGSKQSVKQQTAATRALLGRVSVGLPGVGLNAPGTSTALSNQQTPAAQPQNAGNQHLAGGAAQGLQEGRTGTGSDGKKYVVRNGTWVPQ